uniref:ShKT domain-containing protein n=1 Tax=Steinernema glaseri TaxID=37863 RepID=A0A1I7Y5W3_9BILA
MWNVQALLLLGFLAIITGAELQCIGSCCDKDEQCFKRAESGECAERPGWMLRNCPASCGLCPEQSKCPSVHTIEDGLRHRMTKNKFVNQFQMSQCAPLNQPTDCKLNMCYHLKFRSFDGACNNLHMSLLGAAYRPFKRLLSPNYDDRVNAATGSLMRILPNPRDVTLHLLRSGRSPTVRPNSLFMQWGQFLAHDMTANGLDNKCQCGSNDRIRCANIKSTRERRCISFTRSIPACGTGIRGDPREQVNRNTPFIDASVVYGSDHTMVKSLRKGLSGFLRDMKATHDHKRGHSFPPLPSETTFSVGDDRSNVFFGLGAFHTIFLRLHNKIAKQLKSINPGWDGERLFQETRKIVGAYMQVITYQEFLPALLGDDVDSLIPPYSGYKPTVDPAVANEFAGAAFRLHGLIMPSFPSLDHRWHKYEENQFSAMQLNDSRVVDGGTDDLIRGMMSTPSRAPQTISLQVTEKAFGGLVDLASINIQRGRDHGFQPYNEYRRKVCNLPPVWSFSKWRGL